MKKQLVEKLASLIIVSFSLVAALAWNDAISSLFKEGGALHFLAEGGPWIYAILITILALIATLWIGKISEKV